MNLFKHFSIILMANIVVSATIHGSTPINADIFPKAAYYIIHSDKKCFLPPTFDSGEILRQIGSTISGSTLVENCHCHSGISPLLEYQRKNQVNPCVVTFHDSSCNVIATISNLADNKETHRTCLKKLDPSAKRKATHATIYKCWKTGYRCLSFFDAEKNEICTIHYEEKNTLSLIKAAPHAVYNMDTSNLKYARDYTEKGTWYNLFGKKITA